MELLNPVEFCMLEGRVQEEDIVFRFQLKSDLLGYKVEPVVVLIFGIGKADKLLDPVLDKRFQPFGKDDLKLSIELRDPDVEIGNISLVEIINHFLNLVQLAA